MMNSTKRIKRVRIKSKPRFIISMIIIIGLMVTGLSFATGTIISTALTETQYTEVTIVSGDTLWDIANTYKSNDTDTRKAVYDICKINCIEPSEIQPGMIIKVPENL